MERAANGDAQGDWEAGSTSKNMNGRVILEN